jgi:hypothetical protein
VISISVSPKFLAEGSSVQSASHISYRLSIGIVSIHI